MTHNPLETFNNFNNLDNLDNLDDLDNLDCSKFFEDVYNNLIQSTESSTTDRSKCSRCDSSEFVEDYTLGIVVCSCGEVINNIYDYAPDNKCYDDDTKQETKRYNKITNELLPLSSLGTKLPYNIRGNLQKLQNWGAMPYRERSLYNDFKIINDRCDKLKLTKNIQQSANIFYAAAKSCKHQSGENIGKHIITRGKNNKGIQGGSIWIACKKNNTPISTKDIAEHFGLTIKELNKGIRSLLKLLGIKNMPVQINVIGSEEYVKKYCNEMNIKDEYTNQAIKIARNIDKLNIITEHTQFSIAATSVLIMAELNSITSMTKKSLKNMFGVSNVTISKAYKKLEKIKHILINDEKINKLVNKLNKLNDETRLSEDIKLRMEKFGIVNTEKEEIKLDNIDKKLDKQLDKQLHKNIDDSDEDDKYYKEEQEVQEEEKQKIKIICKPIKKIKDKSKDKLKDKSL